MSTEGKVSAFLILKLLREKDVYINIIATMQEETKEARLSLPRPRTPHLGVLRKARPQETVEAAVCPRGGGRATVGGLSPTLLILPERGKSNALLLLRTESPGP